MTKALANLEEVFGLLDKAIATNGGLRVKCPSLSAAKALRFRCYYARKEDRKQAAKMDPDDPTTSYDRLVFHIENNSNGVFLLIDEFHDEGFEIFDSEGNQV